MAYKAPSSIHETVVHTLRREKDNLALALQNQRETNLALTKQMSNLGLRVHDLEAENARLNSMSNEDQRNVEILDHRYQDAVRELDQLRAKVADYQIQFEQMKRDEERAYQDAEAANQSA